MSRLSSRTKILRAELTLDADRARRHGTGVEQRRAADARHENTTGEGSGWATKSEAERDTAAPVGIAR